MSINLKALCYLAAWEKNEPIDGGIAFFEQLQKYNLDYSIESLNRIDDFLDSIHREYKPKPDQFLSSPENINLLYLLAFYIGELIGRSIRHYPKWFSGQEASQSYPEHPFFDGSFASSLFCRFPGNPHAQLDFFRPLYAISSRLFEGPFDKSVRASTELFLHRPDDEFKTSPSLLPLEPNYIEIDTSSLMPLINDDFERQKIMKSIFKEDELMYVFDNINTLLEHGRTVWGALIQANNRLFKQEYILGAPGEILYDPQGRLSPDELVGISRILFSLKERDNQETDLKVIGDYLKNELIRVFNQDIPKKILPYSLKISSTFFDQLHLPDGTLTLPYFPILISDQCPGAVIILPSQVWPSDLYDKWMAVSEQTFGKRMTASELRSNAEAPTQSGSELYEQGLQYYHGWNVLKNYHQAKQCWEQAAQAGHCESMIRLGSLYEEGQGIPINLKEAFKWYQLAALSGSVFGKLNLGKMYLRYDGPDPDTTKGLFWLREAAACNNKEALELIQDIEQTYQATESEKYVRRLWKKWFR